MSTLKLSDLSPALRALRLLSVDFGHLSAPDVSVSNVCPERLDLAFHDDLPGFEAWREALSLAPETVEHRTQREGHLRVLAVQTDYEGAVLSLIGFAKVVPSMDGGTP